VPAKTNARQAARFKKKYLEMLGRGEYSMSPVMGQLGVQVCKAWPRYSLHICCVQEWRLCRQKDGAEVKLLFHYLQAFSKKW